MPKFARVLLAVVVVSGSSAFMVASTPSEACSSSSCCPPRQCPGGPTPCPVCPSCGFAQPATE